MNISMNIQSNVLQETIDNNKKVVLMSIFQEHFVPMNQITVHNIDSNAPANRNTSKFNVAYPSVNQTIFLG